MAPRFLTPALDSAVQCPGIAPGASAPIGAPALTVQNASRSLGNVRGQACPPFGTSSTFGFLDELLALEIRSKSEKHLTMRVSMARFPFQKTLDAFDFKFQPWIDPTATGRARSSSFKLVAGLLKSKTGTTAIAE